MREAVDLTRGGTTKRGSQLRSKVKDNKGDQKELNGLKIRVRNDLKITEITETLWWIDILVSTRSDVERSLVHGGEEQQVVIVHYHQIDQEQGVEVSKRNLKSPSRIILPCSCWRRSNV